MTAYRVAIDQTTRIIDKRAIHYRNLIAVVVLISLVSIGWAIVTWAWTPLAGFFLFVPVCGLYFILDSRLLNNWRSQLFERWTKGEIDFRAFGDALGANPTLPKGTVQSMLATLPSAGDLLTEQGISSSTREAISAVITTIHACRADALACKCMAWTIITGSIMFAVALWAWQPLIGVLAASSILLLRKCMKTWRLKNTKEKTLAAQQQPDFTPLKYHELVTNLNWVPISASEKDKLLAAFSSDR